MDPAEVNVLMPASDEGDESVRDLHHEIKEFRTMVKESFAEQRHLLTQLIRLPPLGAKSQRSWHLGAAVEALHEHDTWRPPKEAEAKLKPGLGKSKSADQIDRYLHDYGFADMSRLRKLEEPSQAQELDRSEAGETLRVKRISETSLLSLESAPDKASPAGLTSPSMQASGTEILEALASPRSFSKDPQHDQEGTETFVTSQIHQQQRKAVEVARSHSERRMSVLTSYNADRSNSKSWSRRAERVTSSTCFTYGIMSVILANMILLGVEVDFTARLPQSDIPPWFVLANGVVVLIFVVELCLLFSASGVNNFFCGPDRSWNIFDFSIIAWSVLETSIELWALTVATPEAQVSASHLRFVRTMRLVRAFRGVRVVRLLRYVSALRTLVLSIISSMASLCWTLALLVLLFYSFGIVFTQLVMDYCRDEAVRSTGDVNAQPVCPNNVAFYWASVPESMLTLFTAITGGMNWEDAMASLRLISPLAASCFVFYIAIAVLAVVNVVTGVFCSTAMESASADKEIATMKQLQRKNAQVADLRRVFQEIVTEENLVNLQEFQNAMNLPRFANFLESMGISTEDIAILFTVIDADRSGLIDLDEFVQGCMQLHGPAKSLQLAKMSFENKITRQAIKAIGSALLEMRLEMRQEMTSLQESVERFSV